jgi:hypothetical protein
MEITPKSACQNCEGFDFESDGLVYVLPRLHADGQLSFEEGVKVCFVFCADCGFAKIFGASESGYLEKHPLTE